MSKEIVKYNNKMNKIPLKNFEKIDMNFFYAICSKVKNVGSDQVEIPFDDLKEMTGYDQSQNRLVNDLDRMNSKLIQCRGRFEDEDEFREKMGTAKYITCTYYPVINEYQGYKSIQINIQNYFFVEE